jgi:uncharacterized iron-regulated membrane protein
LIYRFADLVHRWVGGVLGLILVTLGVSGSILVHKEDWIALPHANDALISEPSRLGASANKLLAAADGGESIIFASERFGLLQLRDQSSGLYATQSGEIVTRWNSQWERPEIWLFDLHHHLFAGETGEIVIGIAGLAVLLFVITGSLLWWRTRRTFRLRLWPTRMTRPAIRMHHRDLGIVVAPMLFLVALTGTMMIFRPVAGFVLLPLSSPKQIEADLTAPKFQTGKLSKDLDWVAVIQTAQAEFPRAQLRIVSLPKKVGDPITVRMKQADEWLPNGRTLLWFDPASGKLLGKRDALSMHTGTQAFNMAYPIHAGKIGGFGYRLFLTFIGLALVLLGSLSVWSFWFNGKAKPSQAQDGR